MIREAINKEVEDDPNILPLLSSEERFEILLLTVLLRDEPIVIKQLEHILGVSRPTIIKDLNRAEDWFAEQNLQLVRRPGYGIEITGNEEYLRETLVNLILDLVCPTSLLAYCDGYKTLLFSELQASLSLRKTVLSVLDNLDLRTYKYLVGSVVRSRNLIFTDQELISLIMHLAILVKRGRMGKFITTSFNLDQEKYSSQLDFAHEISKRIENRAYIKLPMSEIEFIAIQVSYLKSRPRSMHSVMGTAILDSSPEIQKIVENLLREASFELHPYLQLDNELITNLSLHIKTTVEKLKMGFSIRNPLLQDIQREYPYIFKIAKKSSTTLSTELNLDVPDEEVGFIAMHFAAALERLRPFGAKKRVLVISGNGLGANALLVSRIHSAFPDILVEDVWQTSTYIENNIPPQIDGVITTIPNIHVDIPCAVVNSLLTEEDKITIRNTFFPTNSESYRLDDEKDQPSITDLLTKETVRVNVVCSSWVDAVDYAGNLLLSNKMIEVGYINAIKDLMVKYGTRMLIMPGVALLHARPEDGVRRLGMSLITFHKPITFGNSEFDPVYIVICLAAINNLSHVKPLMQLMAVLKNQELRKKLQFAEHEEELLRILAESI